MPFQIPDALESVDDAREAVTAFMREVRDPMFLWRGLLQQPFDVARGVMQGLQRDPDALGPVLRAAPRNGEAYLVGRATVPDGRAAITVALPPAAPSKVDAAGWGSVSSRGPVVPFDLAEVTAAAGVAYALAERASTVADALEVAGGRRRQVGLLRDEAGELEAFGMRLEDQISGLADQWRAAAGQQHSPTLQRPATNPVNLR